MSILAIVLIVLNSCKSDTDYGKMAQSLIRAHAKEYKKSHGWILDGLGAGGPADLETLFLSYETDQQVDISEARKLYVDCMESVLARLNSDIEIRPLLRDFPATWKNIELDLSFNDLNAVGKISRLAVINGNLCYWTFEEDHFSQHKVTFEEPYEEAVRIVHEQR